MRIHKSRTFVIHAFLMVANVKKERKTKYSLKFQRFIDIPALNHFIFSQSRDLTKRRNESYIFSIFPFVVVYTILITTARPYS